MVSDVHEGLIGETDLCFTDKTPFDQVDVVFFCFGHGKSEQFLKEHTIPAHVKIIDLHKTSESKAIMTIYMVCRKSTKRKYRKPCTLPTQDALQQPSNWPYCLLPI